MSEATHINGDSTFYVDTLFVIVIYNCNISQSAAYQSLSKSISAQNQKDIFVYDNSERPQIISGQNEGVHYYHNPLNAGVSGAYNKAFEKAKALNKKWLLLADQDTHFDNTALREYARNVALYPAVTAFAPQILDNAKLLSPFRLLWGKGIKIRSRQPGIYFFRHLKVINSGLLVSLHSFEAAGGYDELFPMDFSDMIFIERLSTVTEKFVLVNATLSHSLSSESDQYSAASVVLNRFERLCKAAILFKKRSNKSVSLSLILIPRAIKLAMMKKDMRFLRLALRTVAGS